jgi:glycosyltransferase involved in cell wall biosynthesis
MSEPRISVCICTYNRCESLERALASLAQQTGVNWRDVEIVVIDNNCTDHTAQVVDGFARQLPIRRVVETNQGLSHARNRALAEANGEWLLFTDDDMLFDERWIAAYLDALRRFPEASYAGGRMLPRWEGAAPRWFRGERLALMDGLLGWFDLGGDTREFAPGDPAPYGASFAVRITDARKLGRFRTDLGVSGAAMGRGEETEFLTRARQQGARGVYVHDAVNHHRAEPWRFTPFALYRHGRAKAREHLLTGGGAREGSRLGALGFALRGLAQLARGRGDRFRQCLIHVGIQHGLAVGEELATRAARP